MSNVIDRPLDNASDSVTVFGAVFPSLIKYEAKLGFMLAKGGVVECC